MYDTTLIYADNLTRLHEVTDFAKYETIAASMAKDGWRGRPILAVGSQALTGSHRLSAASSLEMEIPVLQLDEDNVLIAASNYFESDITTLEDFFQHLDGDEERCDFFETMRFQAAAALMAAEIEANGGREQRRYLPPLSGHSVPVAAELDVD